MILITGGAYQGKKAYALETIGVKEPDIVKHVELVIRGWLDAGLDPQAEIENKESAWHDKVLLLEDITCGVVPMEAKDRAWREAVGRCGAYLARQADYVVRVFCGIGMVIKGEGGGPQMLAALESRKAQSNWMLLQAMEGVGAVLHRHEAPRAHDDVALPEEGWQVMQPMEDMEEQHPEQLRSILLLRHGATEANEKKVFSGAKDIPLSAGGVETLERMKALYPQGSVYFTSGMLRTRQTLHIIYGDVLSVEIPELREYCLGDFEGRSHEELMENEPAYRAWVDVGWKGMACPGGESVPDFYARVDDGWRKLLDYRWDGLAVLVAHGGVIGHILQANASGCEVPEGTVDNGAGWRVQVDAQGRIVDCEAFTPREAGA